MGRLPYSRHVTFIDYAIKEPLTRFRLFSNPVKPISRALQSFLLRFFSNNPYRLRGLYGTWILFSSGFTIVYFVQQRFNAL